MLVLGLGYTGNPRHHIFQRPTCFSHPLHDATLTPLASVFWHMAFLALPSGNLCSFGVASFSEIACPFTYCSHTPCLFLLAYGVPGTSLFFPAEGWKGAHFSWWTWGKQECCRINVSGKLLESWVRVINCTVWIYLTQNYWMHIMKKALCWILQEYKDMISVLTEYMS